MKKLLLLAFLLYTPYAFSNWQKDTLKTEVKNNNIYIKHQVESGQTLYSLTKKYNCTPNQIFEVNPTLNNNPNLKFGQILLIPLIQNNKIVKAVVSKKEAKIIAKQLSNDNSERTAIKKEIIEKSKKIKAENRQGLKLNKGEHIVAAGETVYSISKKYDISTNMLCKLNGIENQNIKVGQILKVDSTGVSHNESTAKLQEIKALEKPTKETEIQNLEIKPVLPNEIKIAEEGIAEVINTSSRSQKMLALHKSAPVGSVIQITNEANGATILAKVVGNISSTGPDQEILVKLSPAAYRKLNPTDSRMRAKVVYFTKNFGVI